MYSFATSSPRMERKSGTGENGRREHRVKDDEGDEE
jgi:hypothetical protein